MSMEFFSQMYQAVKPITPSNSAKVRYRGFLVKGAGDIAFVDALGNSTTLTIAAGDLNKVFPISITQVLSTGTTATGIQGLV